MGSAGRPAFDHRAFVPRIALAMHATDGGAVHRRADGSLVFVDISGFTAMSERLARFGKVGAEEVTGILSEAFTRLLARAYDVEGSLLKFGGDALLLHFIGDQHVHRAVHAAHAMRQELRDLGQVTSSAGKVRLRMSVGVHTGPLDLYLVGGRSHRDFVVVGPVASHTVEMEGTASAGEIVVSGAVADVIGPRATGRAKGDGFLLRQDPLPDPAPPASYRGKVDVEGASLLPAPVRNAMADGVGDSEHRNAVVAFIHVDGTDEMTEHEGPAVVLRRLSELVDVIQAAAQEHGVACISSDLDVDGCKFILTAGVPDVHADVQERMLRTVRAIAEAGVELPVRIGVHHGPVFAGVIGPPYRLTYTVMGDTVNLAARVMAHATPGQVLATPEVVEGARAAFATSPVEPFAAKGKAKPVVTVAVGRLIGRHVGGRAHAVTLPMVGRQEETETLSDLWEHAKQGRGQVVQLLGPAGIGKSRLANEFRDLVQPPVHLVAACDPYESTTPYHPFRRLIRRVLAVPDDADARAQCDAAVATLERIAPDLVQWSPLIGHVAGLDLPSTRAVDELSDRFRPARLRRSVGELFARLITHPVLVRVDDVHWIDPASAALLDHLLRTTVPTSPLLVVITSREPLPGAREVRCLELAPLGAEAASAMARHAAVMGLIDLGEVATLVSRAGGHPLFLRELLVHRGDGDELPASIDALIGARIDRLPGRAKTLLRHAALLGQRFDLDLLRAVTGDAIDVGVLGELAEFVQPDPTADPGTSPTFEFVQTLFREVAYEALPFKRRRELHEIAGRVIETRNLGRTEEVAELLALHYHRAGRHDRSWEFCRIAADRAGSRFATDEAVQFHRWALEAGRKGAGTTADLISTATRLGDLLEVLGSYDEAEAAYGTARRLVSDDPTTNAELLFRQGIIRERVGKYPAAIRWYRRARRTLGDATGEARRLALRIRLREVEVRLRQGRRDLDVPARLLLRDVQEELHGRALENADRELIARTHYVCGWANLGTPSISILHREEALTAYQELGDVAGQALVWMGAGNEAYHQGRWQDAVSHFREAGDLYRRMGDTVHHAISVNNAGEVLSDRGAYGEARAAFDEARGVWSAAGFTLGVGVARHNLGRLDARAGRFVDAEIELDAAVATFSEVGAQDYLAESLARQAELAWFQADPGSALAFAGAANEIADAQPWTRCLAARIRALVAMPTEPDLARRLLEEIADQVRHEDSRFERACNDLALARCLEDLGDVEAAVVAAAQATVSLRQLDVEVSADRLLDGPVRGG